MRTNRSPSPHSVPVTFPSHARHVPNPDSRCSHDDNVGWNRSRWCFGLGRLSQCVCWGRWVLDAGGAHTHRFSHTFVLTHISSRISTSCTQRKISHAHECDQQEIISYDWCALCGYCTFVAPSRGDLSAIASFRVPPPYGYHAPSAPQYTPTVSQLRTWRVVIHWQILVSHAYMRLRSEWMSI